MNITELAKGTDNPLMKETILLLVSDPSQREQFLKGAPRKVRVPGSSRTVDYDSQPRTAIGISRLGTSEAVEIGAYAFALQHLKCVS